MILFIGINYILERQNNNDIFERQQKDIFERQHNNDIFEKHQNDIFKRQHNNYNASESFDSKMGLLRFGYPKKHQR